MMEGGLSIFYTPARVGIGLLGLSFLIAVSKCAYQDVQAGRDIADISEADVAQVFTEAVTNFGTAAAWMYKVGDDGWIIGKELYRQSQENRPPQNHPPENQPNRYTF